MKENNHAMDLISKYLAGEANAEEAMQLDDWLEEPENRKEFGRLTKLWHQLPGTAVTRPPATQQVWSELEPTFVERKGPLFTRLLLNRYAAAVVTGLAFFLLLTWFKTGKDVPTAQQKVPAWLTKAATTGVQTATLPDGSFLTINKNSSVAYTSNFNKAGRELLLKGECYFNVVHNTARPFIITVGELKVQVVGTSFNIRQIPANESIEVQVQSGVVKMYTSKNELLVRKGQTGIYSTPNQVLTIKDTLNVNSLSYATKTFYFNDLSLVEACHYLENAFNVAIKLDAEKFKDCRLSAQFDNKPLIYILDVINATLNTTYHQQGHVIYITGNGCK